MIPEIKRLVKDSNIIMVGDNKAREMEDAVECDITKLCCKIPFITSALLTKYVDLVISVDSGVLHASGCYDTPKIALLGNSTKENITKHFRNCYTFEANCYCAPCFKTIFCIEECEKDELTGSCLCMGQGISLFDIINKVVEIRRNSK